MAQGLRESLRQSITDKGLCHKQGVASRRSRSHAPRTRMVPTPFGIATFRWMGSAPWVGAPVLGPQALQQGRFQVSQPTTTRDRDLPHDL